MNPMEYGHYNDENLKKALRASEDALDQARAEKRRWLEELAEQAAADILNRIELNNERAAGLDNVSADELRGYNQRDAKWLLTSLINAVQEANRRIPSN